jgi:hypothetical protein
VSRSPNRLIASLSPDEYRRIAPALRTARFTHGSALPLCGGERVYFPGTGVCSILRRMSDATTIEVASVGSEGAVGLPALGDCANDLTYLQVSYGSSQYMTVERLLTLSEGSEFGEALDRFCGVFTRSVMRLVACNRMHEPAARCARWLLLTHERVGRAHFELTQPFLAMAIGIPSNELSRLMAQLAFLGTVKHDASTLTIVDLIALKRMACSCYGIMKNMLAVPMEAEIAVATTTGNVLPMRPLNVCTLCGLIRNAPHRTHFDCLRAVDAEIRGCIQRAKELTSVRAQIAVESMTKFDKLLVRRQS